MTKAGLSKHFYKCSKFQAAIEHSRQKQSNNQEIYHLLVQDKWQKDFWLHLEMRGSTPLKKLDYYLREIWLECCGHLSQFSERGFFEDEIAMSTTIEEVFQPGTKLDYTYDFGTSSELVIQMVEKRIGKFMTNNPVYLMARNEMPEVFCMECSELASFLCMECIIVEDESGLLCQKHAINHPHEDYGEPLPLVNSPRLGMCGYDGPAEAPY